jgi:hypothetical protein
MVPKKGRQPKPTGQQASFSHYLGSTTEAADRSASWYLCNWMPAGASKPRANTDSDKDDRDKRKDTESHRLAELLRATARASGPYTGKGSLSS